LWVQVQHAGKLQQFAGTGGAANDRGNRSLEIAQMQGW